MKHSHVTFIGLGQMGAALVPPFIRAGVKATVWNRSLAKAEPLVAQGAYAAQTLAEAIQASDLIIVCLADYETSNALLQRDEMTPLLKGKTLVQFTTGSAKQAQASAQWAAEIGVDYLDGAIMDYPTQVGLPECMLLVSGPETVWDSCSEAMLLLGGRMTYVGAKTGSANVLDGCLLTMYYANTFGLMQAAAMLQAESLDIKDLGTALIPFQPVIDSTCARTISAIDRNDYSGNEASMLVHLLGVQSLLGRAKGAGIEHSLLQLFTDFAQKTFDSGHAEDELTSVYTQFKPRG
jgi:3-hydroxyisobutyrate dehydrogenase-like beta-hydroxyacid dehydrogenase